MDIQETNLPGVGLRHDTTRAGRQLKVVTHRTGRRDLLVYDRDDPTTPARRSSSSPTTRPTPGRAARERPGWWSTWPR